MIIGKIKQHYREGDLLEWLTSSNKDRFHRCIFLRTVHLLTKYIINKPYKKSECVWKRKWDNLMILDACRWDLFYDVLQDMGYKVANKPYIYSRGSDTVEFLERNFKNRYFDDIVYVTANPFVNKVVEKSFYKVIPVWRLRWDKQLGTVLPEDVIKFALIAKRRYPKKRVIIHFIQPHYPFIGSPIKFNVGTENGFGMGISFMKNPWNLVRQGILKSEEVWQAYTDNAKYIIPYALKLASKLPGKTVISADHGNVFIKGPLPEFTIAGHPRGVYIEELVKVPWFEVDQDEVKKVLKQVKRMYTPSK